jgi:hypothetical protein
MNSGEKRNLARTGLGNYPGRHLLRFIASIQANARSVFIGRNDVEETQPLRDALFSLDQLEQHGRSLAAAYVRSRSKRYGKTLLSKRLQPRTTSPGPWAVEGFASRLLPGSRRYFTRQRAGG